MKNLFLTKTRWLVTIILLTALGIGNAWGANVTWEQVAWDDITTSDVFIITITNSSGTTYLMNSANGKDGTPKLGYTGTLNAEKTKCTFSENDDVKWKKDSQNRLCMATDAGKWIYTNSSNNALRVGTGTTGNTWSLDGNYIKSNASRYLSLYGTTDFRSYTSKQSGQVTRFFKAASCTTSPTVTAASNSSVTATTATVSCSSGISPLGSDGCSISSYGFVIGKSSNPEIGGSGVTQHEVGTTYTSTGVSFSKDLTGLTAETTYYVRPYATNGNGTAYGTQTTFTTSALPKYTVTLKDDDDTRTQASAGASVTLPVRAGCAGYTFAGWTKTWVTDQTEWTTTAPTIIPAGSYTPTANENLYPVYTKEEGGGGSSTVTFTPGTDKGETSITKNGVTCTMSTMNNASYYQIYANASGTFSVASGNITAISFTCTANGTTKYGPGNASADVGTYTYSGATGSWSGSASSVTISSTAQVRMKALSITCSGGSTTSYISVPNCCTPLGTINGSINLSQLATPDPTKLKASWAMNAATGIASYTLEVYDSSDNLVKTINNYTSGSEITGLTPCTGYYVKLYTVSSGGEYCDGGLIGTSGSCTTNGYTLTVKKSNVSLNSGSEPTNICGDVSATYAASAGYTLPTSISVTNAGAENTGWTWNSSTGVLTINKASVTGNVTVTITGTAQSNFPNNKTIFIQAHSTSAWTGGGCVMAWFHSYGGSETAQPTYWLFDAGGPDEGKKLFAAIVPTTGDLPYLDIQRFAANCSDWWNKNGGCSYSDAAGSNTIRSEGSGNDQVYWNASGVTLSLYGDPNSWASSLGTFADQGAGIWTATYNNYAPANAAGETQNFKISTNYNGWIGNTGSNNNATLDGMHVGSTYNITATLDVKDHSLTMSKTFVKGTVHFDLQGHGSTISDLTNVAAGSKISAPSPAPSATGWDFGGWFKEPACTNEWNFASDVVNETMTLYAKWTAHEYTITKTLTNVTSSPVIPSTYTYTGAAAGLNYTISPSDGYRLPTEIAVSGTTYTWNPATGALALTGTISSNVTITISAVQTHTVTWMNNGSNYGDPVVYDHGAALVLPASDPSAPSSCSGKVFVGWTSDPEITSETSTEPTIISAGGAVETDATYRAVFATSSANPLAGTVIWDEPFNGNAGDQPSSPTSGATVYGSASIVYNCASTTYCKLYTDNPASGGAAVPELLVPKSERAEAFVVTGIPTAEQLELKLTYYSNQNLSVTTGTSGVTVDDANNDGKLYTRTITVASALTTSFDLTFEMSTNSNARLDDIHLVVPGSGTMTDYVTLCAPSWTITYDKNTSDPVTNLPSPTSVLQSTGSGTLSATEPTRATYTFGGWATTADGAKVYDAGAEITGVTADKTLYAVWTKTPVEKINLNYFALEKYVGDDAVTLAVTSVVPDGADMSVTWSSSNPSVAPVVAATGVVSFDDVGTATITATSTVTGTTTAVCYVTVRNKPTATFVDLIHNGNGTDLSTYYLQNVAGTSIVFPTLSNTEPGTESCEDQHYIFVGWTTSDNNDDPQDHLVTSDALENDVNKTFYAIWADGVEGSSYTQLTSNSFETAPTKYVIGVNSSGTMYYFNSCAKTGENNSWGYTTKDPTNNPPIQFTLSGTASELVATSTETTARYIVPLTTANFKMSTSSQTLTLNADGTIHNTGDNNAYALRGNSTNLRWYSNNTGNPAYFYKVEAGSAVSYRTSCCADPLAAPSVTATNTAYTVTLTWNAVAGATGYEVSWNNGAWTAATSPVNKTSLTASTTYTYKVRATYNEAVHCGARVASGNVTTDDVYSVTYSGGTGTGSCSPTGSVAAVTYEAGATVTLAATNSFSLTSNTFAAWVVKDAENNDVAVSNNQFTMPASNVTVTATWTAVQDKYYDRMHQSTDASQGGIADGNGKYYIVREGCNYTVPSPADDSTGDTDCHTTHFKLLGWIAQSHLKSDGSIKDGEESHLFQGGTIKSATGATYYAIYAIMTE